MAAAELDALSVRLLYSPHQPEPPQHAYLWLNRLEALYGGAAGGGKSDALLMAALQYVDVPRYSAILFRKTYQDLALPGALIDRSKEWLEGTDARWSEVDHRWTFPSTATLSFGYLQTSTHKYRYQGAEFQFVGFDELTQFDEGDYSYLFSRLRKPSGLNDDHPLAGVPLRMRGASNPGGRGHVWVKRRFIDRRPDPNDHADSWAKCRRRVFIPASLKDNPHVDHASYLEALGNLTAVERARLLDGDWNADTGDRYYPAAGIDAALKLGTRLDELGRQGKAPPPVGDLIALGADWGDHKFYVVGWPLEAGGMWIVAGGPLTGVEVGDAAERILDDLERVYAWAGAPARRLDAVDEVRYDAAGLESNRTFMAVARRRRRNLRAKAIPFGNFKRTAGQWGRVLLERAAAGDRIRILAIGELVDPMLVEQLRNLRRDPNDEELPLKPERRRRGKDGAESPDGGPDEEARDDGPDAMLALLAPVAVRHRNRVIPKPRPDPRDPRQAPRA